MLKYINHEIEIYNNIIFLVKILEKFENLSTITVDYELFFAKVSLKQS